MSASDPKLFPGGYSLYLFVSDMEQFAQRNLVRAVLQTLVSPLWPESCSSGPEFIDGDLDRPTAMRFGGVAAEDATELRITSGLVHVALGGADE